MTLGEWLNQVILETGTDEPPVADPMRAPDDWMRETGEALPWTRPIEEMSAEVTARLAASEAENTALLGSIETAISGISRRLVELDERGPASAGGELEARLSRIETVQKRALSKDHLRTLETAVSQISVVFDNQTEKQKGVARDHDERIDRSQTDLARLASRLEQTDERVDQALCAVEAAAELYDITDKQGQIVDSLVMDVAAVHAEQKKSDDHSSGELSRLTAELGDLKAQLQTFEGKSDQNASDSGADARLAAKAISEQISANEEKTAGSVAQIEEQIVGLSQILDQSLQVQQTGIEDLRAAFDGITARIETLEGEATGGTRDAEPISVPLSDLETAPDHVAQPETVETPQVTPLTFKTLDQQTSRTVNVNMAVTIDPDFIRVEEETEEAFDLEGSDKAEIQEQEGATPTLNVSVQPVDTEDQPAAPEEKSDVAEPSSVTIEPIDLSEATTAGEAPEPEPQPEIEVVTSDEWQEDVDRAISDHLGDTGPLEDDPLTFADIFGGGEETVLDDGTMTARDPEVDAALREAVTNISSIRASFAAKNQAAGKPGSMRQIVDAGNVDASRRGWALTAGGMIVGLIAISGVLVYSGDTNDLIDAGKRPALLDQITAWLPGRSRVDIPPAAPADPASETVLASTPDTRTDLPTNLASGADLTIGLEEAALAGDAKAQFALGRALASGTGRPVDRKAALEWYRAAASQDLAIAQYVLGSLHERGIDVPQGSAIAIDWYASAARGGNRRSMHNLAVAYARGDVIAQDLAQSAYWFSEAAELGLPDSQYNLALLHERGLGIEKDPATAWKWYRIAAASGDKSAVAQAERLGEKLTANQRKTAQGTINAWQPREMAPIANGLFDISPAAWDNGRQRNELAVVQSRLMTLGYALAGSDGIMDPATRKAIETFQASRNLEVTGTMSPGLYESLIEAEANKGPTN